MLDGSMLVKDAVVVTPRVRPLGQGTTGANISAVRTRTLSFECDEKRRQIDL